jgi:hypothetical protein
VIVLLRLESGTDVVVVVVFVLVELVVVVVVLDEDEELHPPPPDETAVIVTVRVILPVFPAASTFLYVRVYVPATDVFTDPEDAVAILPVPSTLSDHVAPRSVNADPCVRLTVPEPTRETTGAV